jgi:hypothetical protein
MNGRSRRRCGAGSGRDRGMNGQRLPSAQRGIFSGRLSVVLAAAVLAEGSLGGYSQSAWGQRARGTANVEALRELERVFQQRAGRERAAAIAWANRRGVPLRTVHPNGRVTELMGIRDGRPIYYTTENLDAADSVSTDDLWPGGSSGFNLTGAGVVLHLWDSGEVLLAHQEFGGRASWADNTSPGTASHSTHVAGTMIAAGVDGAAHGMAGSALLNAYDWGSDESEMAAAAADGARVSSHSYSPRRGWTFDSGDDEWFWSGDVDISPTEDAKFGYYDDQARDWDEIAFNAPFYLICKSASNNRNDVHDGGHFVWIDGGWVWSTDPRDPDGGATGFDCLPQPACAKNVLSVGAVADVVGGYSGPGSVVMTSFSGWGPTDDGRIKPDIAGNGVSLYSCDDSAANAYTVKSGTSMSTPNLAGSFGPLIQHYRNTHSGLDMRAATLKGLVIHTADEAGSAPGPDYEFGWGLFNGVSAAQQIALDESVPTAIQELSLGDGQAIQLTGASNGAGPIKVTISWTDPPGTPPPLSLDPPDLMLVNDLDVRLTGPDATVYEPWVLDPTNPAAPATRGDNIRDNVEVVGADAPPAGQYTVEISHKGILSAAPQEFSLIVSGLDPAESCPWDCGTPADEQVSVVDFLIMLAQWGQSGTSCDFDGGGVSVTDFLELLGHWGPCP